MTRYVPLRLNSSQATMVLSSVALFGFAALVALEVIAISQQSKVALDPIFCSPSALHTTPEPPETQLTRDYAAIRILLKNPKNQLGQIERLYSANLHVPAAFSAPRSVLKRADRARLIKAAYHSQPWTGSLREEAIRIDAIHGTSLNVMIERALQQGDATQVETGLRLLFATLLNELLQGLEQRVDNPIAVNRGIQHARRYYRDALDAYLTINAPETAAPASFALEAMIEASRELESGSKSARGWFIRERADFMRAVRDGLPS
jgi:hypothetical protein